VLTIHDLIYYRHPKPPANLSPLLRLGWRLFHLTYIPERILLAGCNAVVAVSTATLHDIRKNRLTRKPIAVVHNAPERREPSNSKRRVEKTLVYMGTFMPYKNVETLIRGVGLLGDYRLELLSRISPNRRAELEALADECQANVVFHNGVSDQRYLELLDSTTALVSASLDEGFGIPVVEALAHGVPVAVSDIEIFREVAGEVGVFFDPNKPQEFADSIRKLAAKPRAPAQLRAQAAKFNWDDSATELLKLIESI
jgi:glycosyltransferase involved in cell wall biosynthesis